MLDFHKIDGAHHSSNYRLVCSISAVVATRQKPGRPGLPGFSPRHSKRSLKIAGVAMGLPFGGSSTPPRRVLLGTQRILRDAPTFISAVCWESTCSVGLDEFLRFVYMSACRLATFCGVTNRNPFQPRVRGWKILTRSGFHRVPGLACPSNHYFHDRKTGRR